MQCLDEDNVATLCFIKETCFHRQFDQHWYYVVLLWDAKILSLGEVQSAKHTPGIIFLFCGDTVIYLFFNIHKCWLPEHSRVLSHSAMWRDWTFIQHEIELRSTSSGLNDQLLSLKCGKPRGRMTEALS